MDEIAREQGLTRDDVEVWLGDEAWVGQKNKITHRRARRGSRPSAPQDQRTASTYIFGAICPEDGKGAGLFLPWCNTEAVSLHLAAISEKVAPGRHAALLVNQAGWHMSVKLAVPANITIVALPAKCPELNPQENIWQFLRDNLLSTASSDPRTPSSATAATPGIGFIDQPWPIMSIGLRQRARRS